MHERTIYSNMPMASLDACCERHQHVPPADHCVACTSFVVEEHEYDEGVMIHEQKFALMILTDGATMARGGVEITPRITMLLLDQFAELMRDTVGPELMAAAMVHAVIEKYGAQVVSDERDDADANDVVRELRDAERRADNPFAKGLGGRQRRRTDLH